MKTSLATVVMLGTLGLTVPTAHAERLTLNIEGDVYQNAPTEENAWLFDAGVKSARVEIIYESELTPFIFRPDEARKYTDAIESIKFEFFDEHDNLLTLPLNTTFTDATEDRVFTNHVSVNSYNNNNLESIYFITTYFATPEQSSWNELGLYVADLFLDEQSFNGDDALPILPNIESSNLSFRLMIYLPEFQKRNGYSLRNVSFQYSGPDDDNDGVMNFYDECEASLTAPTLTIDGVDSGIANGADKDGCTIADHFAACEAQQTGGFPLAYSGPTMCERGVLYDAYRNELITYPELRQLRQLL
ncbi:hypothetical protein CWI80_03835 [Pseudidiomarina sediminum]|uniref:Uncharacterized protein n=1 Tax=Pseudidiomarina sediminum TaxID=431675 RepID=A0A432Z9C7_9GAMM|nr:hypothetical protein [Pseudidiomarina sediminum]RUO74480.1 hypothetical protein CWI80_03835 [Pseudidiomarina sediminum]